MGIAAAESQYALAKANGKQDLNVGGNYSHNGGFNAATFSMSIPLPIFDRNQGEIARTNYAISQARYGLRGTSGQVITDVRDAYESLQTSDRVVNLYRSGNLDISQKNRDISEYAYQRGATSLLDFLDAERSFARLNSPTARRSQHTFWRWSSSIRRWGPETCRDPGVNGVPSGQEWE